jgi:heterotetrameric sarcosine oxidase delta subunit
MFVIRCPHCCEAREEEEFSYAGEAFIARPAAPEELDDEAWGDYVFMKKNPKGWHWEMWSPQYRLPQGFCHQTQYSQPRHSRHLDPGRSECSI